MYIRIFKIAICLMFFAMWMALCFFKYRKWHRRRKNCTKELQVKVVDVKEKKAARGGMLYKPVFEPVGSPEYPVIDSAFYSNMVSFEIGDKVELLINPDNAKEFLYKDNSLNKGILADILCCCLPMICVIGYLLMR